MHVLRCMLYDAELIDSKRYVRMMVISALIALSVFPVCKFQEIAFKTSILYRATATSDIELKVQADRKHTVTAGLPVHGKAAVMNIGNITKQQ